MDVGSPVRFTRRPVPRILQRDDQRREGLMLLPLSLPVRGTFRLVMDTDAGEVSNHRLPRPGSCRQAGLH